MAEWSKAHDWKSCVIERSPWVRIPSPPPRKKFSKKILTWLKRLISQKEIITFRQRKTCLPVVALAKAGLSAETLVKAENRPVRFGSFDKLRTSIFKQTPHLRRRSFFFQRKVFGQPVCGFVHKCWFYELSIRQIGKKS